MRIPLVVTACLCTLVLGWMLADLTWNNNLKKSPPESRIKSIHAFQSQRGVPLSTCTDCYQLGHNRKRKLWDANYIGSHDGVSLAAMHDVILVIATLIITSSWVMLFSLILHGRIQRQMDRRFNAIFVVPFDPHASFIHSRRHG